MRRASRLILGLAMALSAAALVAIDQWTKALAVAHLEGEGRLSLVGDFAVLIFARNRGAFLSLGSGLPPLLSKVFLIVLPVAALGFLAWAFLSRGLGGEKAARGAGGPGRAGALEYTVVALIVAGGVGNLIDRLLYGEVRDFLNFGIGRLRTGIMNLADLYILAALIVMVVAFVRRRQEPSSGAKP